MIVADTNLVAYLSIEGDQTQWARRVRTADSDWIIPPLWRSEFLNVLATSVRGGVLDEEQAFRAWRNATALFQGCEREPGGEATLRTALRFGISAYDAQFVALAVEFDIRLVTGDIRLVRACPGIAMAMSEFGGR